MRGDQIALRIDAGSQNRRPLPPLQGGGVFGSPKPGVPPAKAGSTPGYLLAVPPALRAEALAGPQAFAPPTGTC